MVELTEQVIEAYCTNQLLPEESQEFEVELKSNKDLQKEVRESLITLGAFRDIKAQELRQRINEIDKDNVRPINPRMVWIRYAAAITLMAVAGYLVFNQLFSTSPENIYLSYMEPYPNVIDPGTRDVGTQSIEALQLYEEGNYEAALNSFDDYLHLNPSDIEARFYYGLSAILTERTDIAEIELRSVANSTSRFSNQATWYLALNFIQSGKVEMAKEELQELIDGESSYRKKAQELMKKL